MAASEADSVTTQPAKKKGKGKGKKGGKKNEQMSQLASRFVKRDLATFNKIVGPSKADISPYMKHEKPRNIKLFADSIIYTINNLYQNIVIPIDIIVSILDYGVSEPSELWLYRQFRNSTMTNKTENENENKNEAEKKDNGNDIFDKLLNERGYSWFDHKFRKGHTFSHMNRVANHRTKDNGGAISQICYADAPIPLSNHLKDENSGNFKDDLSDIGVIESIKYETVYCVDIIVAEKSQEMWIGVTWNLEKFLQSSLKQSRLHSYDTSVNNPHCILYYGGQEHKIHAEWAHFRRYFGNFEKNNIGNNNNNNNNDDDSLYSDINSKEIREEMISIIKETQKKNGANWNSFYYGDKSENKEKEKEKPKASQREVFFKEMSELEHRGFINPQMIVKFVEWERTTKPDIREKDTYKDGSLGTIFTLSTTYYKFNKQDSIDKSAVSYELVIGDRGPDAAGGDNGNNNGDQDAEDDDVDDEEDGNDDGKENENVNVNSFENTGVLTCEWYRSGDYITVQVDIETIATKENGILKYAILVFKRNGRVQSKIRIKDKKFVCKMNEKNDQVIDCLQVVAMTCNKIDCLVFDRKK